MCHDFTILLQVGSQCIPSLNLKQRAKINEQSAYVQGAVTIIIHMNSKYKPNAWAISLNIL